MKITTRMLIIAFVMLAACGLTLGQIRRGDAELCSSESVDRLDREFAGRRMSGRSESIEKSYQRILADCPTLTVRVDIELKVRTLTEEWADRSFFIAEYYLKKYWETGHGLNGSRSRFNAIVERTPTYSRIDEVRMWVDHISRLSPSDQRL